MSTAAPTRRNSARRRNALVVRHQGLLVTIARRYIGRGLDLHDLIGEGQFGLLRAATQFDRRLGVRFGSYAGVAIHRAIRDALAASRWRWLGQDDEDDGRIGQVADPGGSDGREHAERRATVDRLLDGLPERERWLVVAYYGLDGEPERTDEDIAAELGITKQRVHQLRVRALRRMRREVGEG